MAKILLVEDDLDFAQDLCDWLRHDKHTVELAENGMQALRKIEEGGFELVILDWQLPDVSGLDVLRQYREGRRMIPVLMLTGKSELDDKTTGLDSGADHYLVKPVEPPVLSAMVRAILRRADTNGVELIQFGDLQANKKSHSIFCRSEQLNLTPNEFNCLFFLLKHANSSTFSAEAILSRVWKDEERGTIAAVRNCISQLRKKLQSSGSQVDIDTEQGFGYRLKLKSVQSR